jgi:hypothetical protein
MMNVRAAASTSRRPGVERRSDTDFFPGAVAHTEASSTRSGASVDLPEGGFVLGARFQRRRMADLHCEGAQGRQVCSCRTSRSKIFMASMIWVRKGSCRAASRD